MKGHISFSQLHENKTVTFSHNIPSLLFGTVTCTVIIVLLFRYVDCLFWTEFSASRVPYCQRKSRSAGGNP